VWVTQASGFVLTWEKLRQHSPTSLDFSQVGDAPSLSFGMGVQFLLLPTDKTAHPKLSKLSEGTMSYKAKVFSIIALLFSVTTGLVVMRIAPVWSVLSAIGVFLFVFWMLCIFTNTQEGAL